MQIVGSLEDDRVREAEGGRMSKHKIDGPFAPRTVNMLRSPAWRVLSLSARRILDRIEIELSDHGGRDNGKLPCTYADFREYGIIHRNAIAAGIRELVALGFLKQTRGRAGNAEYHSPNLFALTYRQGGRAETNEWQAIKTVEEAEAIAAKARTNRPKKSPPGRKFPGTGNRYGPGIGKRTNQYRKPVLHGAQIPGTGIRYYLDANHLEGLAEGSAAPAHAPARCQFNRTTNKPHQGRRPSTPAGALRTRLARTVQQGVCDG
jgi:hypothetical protein